jgi:hypothetical protein
VGCNGKEDPNAPRITMPSSITIDLNKLEDFQPIEVAVISDDEDLVSVKVYVLIPGLGEQVLDNATELPKKTRSWDKTYTLADLPDAGVLGTVAGLDLKFCVDVVAQTTDASRSANITIIPVVIPEILLKGPENFTWERNGSPAATGLEQFGLEWKSQSTDLKIVIKPLSGTKFVILNPADWSITKMEELEELVNNGTHVGEWAVIPAKADQPLNYVIATKTDQGNYYLIHPTNRWIDPADGGHRKVTGEYKY